MKNYLVVIVGPTAVGKTDLAIKLAKFFKTVIISADSRQIYKEMKIGTARPTEKELQAVKHFFIANKSIFDYYNASQYEFEVIDSLKVLYKTYNPILLVGGSGLYINAVLYGIDDMPTIDQKIRQKLMNELEKFGLDYLTEKLKILDPISYQKIDLKNPKRVLKALEITIQTGKPYSSFLTNKPKERFFILI